MIAVARIKAQPAKVNDVRHALEQMVKDSESEDPNLEEYALYESSDEPGCFLIEQRISAVDDRLALREPERLMELGTALREKLDGPIEVAKYHLVTETVTS